MAKLRQVPAGKAFDVAFVKMIIPHHTAGIIESLEPHSRTYDRAMRRAAGVVAAAAIALLVVLAVAGSNRFSGPVLLRIGESHGIHRTDVLVTAVGIAAIGAVVVLARRD